MDATARVRDAGFEPLEPYPGNNRTSWRCRHVECGNEVELKLGGIVSGKNPCKYCNGQWVDPEKAAEVMRQAGLEPLEPYVSSKHKWRCKCSTCGEVVTPQYNSVLVQGSGCKLCGKMRGGKKRRLPEQDAMEVMRAAGYEPLEPYVNSQAHWKSTHVICGREVAPTYGQIRGGNGGCKHCAGLYVDPDEAVLVMRAAGYEPLEPYVNSGHQWKCRCLTCGKETTPSYGEARIGSRCKYCANKAITPEDAVELMQRGGFEPLEPYPGSMNPWMCRHNECGEIMSPRYAHVQQGRRACQHCSKKYQIELLSLDPIEAAHFMRLAGLEPIETYPGSGAPWRCIHIACGREVVTRYASIQQGQGGCKPCHQHRLAVLYRTPDATAIEIMRDAGLEPIVPYPGLSHTPWNCKCTKCERVISPTMSNVKNGATCIFCAGKRIHADDAVLLMKERGLEPLEAFPGGNQRWKCKHLACGRIVTPTYSNVSQGGGGCKSCSDSTFAYDAPGIVYLMKSESFASIKVGITTEKARNDRIQDHRRGGWTLIEKWKTPTGFDAEIIENAILNWWRVGIGAPSSVRREDMPSGGFTETAALMHVDIEDTKQRIEHYLLVLGANEDSAVS
jgi:hypothetical protein